MSFTKIKELPIPIRIWLGVEGFLYLVFLVMDVTKKSEGASYIKFISILFCFLFCFIFYFKFDTTKNLLLLLSLGFSVAADVFLLFTAYFLPGMVFFLLVQSFLGWYLVRCYSLSMKKQIYLRMIPSLFLLWLFKFQGVWMDGVFILGCVYIIFFSCNVICSIYGAIKNPNIKNRLLMLGLILFFCCDINVGIFNFSSYFTLQTSWWLKLESISSVAMWFFYLPGQVMIGLSGIIKINDTL